MGHAVRRGAPSAGPADHPLGAHRAAPGGALPAAWRKSAFVFSICPGAAAPRRRVRTQRCGGVPQD